jgi:hypothetical protein
MRDSMQIDAERPGQASFILFECFQIFIFAIAVLSCALKLSEPAARRTLGPRSTTVNFEAVPALAEGPTLRFAGAWQLRSEDPRFGGFSDLAIQSGRFVALTDNGVVALIGMPTGGRSKALLKELPGGPRSPAIRRGWDTEALELTEDGYWVSFEQMHQLWLYDPSFGRALQRVKLEKRRWADNLGVEGLAADHVALMLFPEGRPEIGRFEGSRVRFRRVDGLHGRFAEAARLPDGRLLALERRFTPMGFRNAVIEMEMVRSSYRVTARHRLRVGALDNMEGMAVQPLPGGWTRLWLISDDNFQRPLRTLLLAMDIPPTRNKVF